jgi:phage gp36-like protein
MIEIIDIKEVLASILSNPDYVSDEVIQKAIEDTKEIVKERLLETPFVLDIAIYRVFMRVNLEVPENVEKAYKEAIKRLKDVPISSDEGSFTVKVSQRNSIWI